MPRRMTGETLLRRMKKAVITSCAGPAVFCSEHLWVLVNPVVPATLAKWLLVCMDRAGICTASYRANYVRSAGASGLRAKGMSLSQVLARGNWSPTTRTFAIFYDRLDLSSGPSTTTDQAAWLTFLLGF